MFKKLIILIGLFLLSACDDSFNDLHLQALAKVNAGAILIDVRSPAEYASGHLERAINIPHTQIVQGITNLGVSQNSEIVLYCRSGNRSGQATASLQNAGFKSITNGGGYLSLLAAQQHK